MDIDKLSVAVRPRNAWEAMDSPEPPTREQIKILKQAAAGLKTTTVTANQKGQATFKQELTPWSLVLIEQIS